MCGKGQFLDSSYLPRIEKTYTPPSADAVMPSQGSVCPAFYGKVDGLFTRQVRAYLEQVDWFWEGRKKLEDIFQE